MDEANEEMTSEDVQVRIPESIQGLVRTFTELMVGDADPEHVELILQWALYMHIRSVMPPLVSHWGQANPEDAAAVKAAIGSVKQLNEQWKASRKPPERTKSNEPTKPNEP